MLHGIVPVLFTHLSASLHWLWGNHMSAQEPHKQHWSMWTNVFHEYTRSLPHWGWVMHICVDNHTIIGYDNSLSPGWCQAIIWTNAGILLTETLGTNFNEFLIEPLTFAFKEMHLKMSSENCQPFCHGLNVLNYYHKPNRAQQNCLYIVRNTL